MERNMVLSVYKVKSHDHMAVLFQMYGSVWHKVLPFCIVSTVLAVFIGVISKGVLGITLTFNDQGHMFMSIMVSVLMVSRSRIASIRYTEARGLLVATSKSCRELVHYVVTFTRYDGTPGAVRWRERVCQSTADLLCSLIEMLQIDSLTLQERQSSYIYYSQHHHQVKESNIYQKQQHHDCLEDESLLQKQYLDTILMAMSLRTTIAAHVEDLSQPLDVNQELRLLSCTSDFLSAYHGLVKLKTTPFPFPLVQMTRTTLFVWVFTLPFALMSNRLGVFAYIFIFFLTYGFIGLEIVSIELDNPFGADANDVHVIPIAQTVMDDIIVCLEDVDGVQAAIALQAAFASRLEKIKPIISINPQGKKSQKIKPEVKRQKRKRRQR